MMTDRRKLLPQATLLLAAIAVLALLAVLHVRASAQDGGTQQVGAEARGETIVYVGGANGVRNISFLDEHGRLTGYDMEVLRAAESHMPGYRFRFVPMEFTGLFAGIDTGKLDIIGCSFAPNPDRARKYLISDGYDRKDNYLTVLASDRHTRSLADMAGRTIEAWSAASSDYFVFREYNQAHAKAPIRIVTSNGDPVIIVKNLVDRRTDAFSTTAQTMADLEHTLGVDLRHAGPPLSTGFAHFLIRRDRPELKAALDRAIAAMIADGTLARLSRQWWKADIAPKRGEGRLADSAA